MISSVYRLCSKVSEKTAEEIQIFKFSPISDFGKEVFYLITKQRFGTSPLRVQTEIALGVEPIIILITLKTSVQERRK